MYDQEEIKIFKKELSRLKTDFERCPVNSVRKEISEDICFLQSIIQSVENNNHLQ
ncbi:hypothetical protein [Peribacillus saganii]|uniref:hypothetical protein n=1 Tax=Peribacillus saganii TaxID=2303992 RepID=UPI001314B638|nr:hypothetical protein [Peribacillus saganii]